MSSILEIQIIAMNIAVACSLVGCFLVLRNMAMISDAISHTLLLGIVLGYFVVNDINSPILIIGATLIGVITVYVIELLVKSNLISKDASIGIVFSLFFSIAIILISLYARTIHLDTDSVLLGELVFAPFDRLIMFGVDIGAKSMYVSGLLVVINSFVIALFYKEFKLCTFDETLAKTVGIKVVMFHYLLMSLTSLTAVGSFNTAGSILVVAFMVGPANIAYIMTNNLKYMILMSMIIGMVCSVVGFNLAYLFDVSIAGMIAVVIGVVFILVFTILQIKKIIANLCKH